jgi:hypothetical protein
MEALRSLLPPQDGLLPAFLTLVSNAPRMNQNTINPVTRLTKCIADCYHFHGQFCPGVPYAALYFRGILWTRLEGQEPSNATVWKDVWNLDLSDQSRSIACCISPE